MMMCQKFYQQVMGICMVGLLLVACSNTSTPEPAIESTVPPVEPTEPIEPTVVPTQSAPIGATVLLLGPEGSYVIEMYSQVSSPLPIVAQLPAGIECEVLSGPRAIEGITLWEIDCSWSDECCGEGYGLWGWVDVTQLEVID